jgi:hypothetical protein
MYKIDLKTLKDITNTLDYFVNTSFIKLAGKHMVTGKHIEKNLKIRKKAEKLSSLIKNNYTEINKTDLGLSKLLTSVDKTKKTTRKNVMNKLKN